MKAGWRREALFVAACFAATTAVPFLSGPTQEAYGAFALGAPPLLILSVVTVAGTAALWWLGQLGYVWEDARGRGVVTALRLAAAMAVPFAIADILHPFPVAARISWPEAWLFYPSLAVATSALLLIPAALAMAVTGRWWLSAAIGAAAEAGAVSMVLDDMAGWQKTLLAGQAFALGLIAMGLLRRHGALAFLALRLGHAVVWPILWGAARPVLLPGP